MDRADREAELLEMRWQQVKAIAETMDPPIDKPEGGWDEAVPLILAAEYPEGEAVADVSAEPVKDAAVKQIDPSAIYPVDFFEASGIPYCDRCGAPEQRSLQGERICPVADQTCPHLN